MSVRDLKEASRNLDLDVFERLATYGIPGELSNRDLAIAAATFCIAYRTMTGERDENLEEAIHRRIEASKLLDEREVARMTGAIQAYRGIINAIDEQWEKLVPEYQKQVAGSANQQTYHLFLTLLKSLRDGIRGPANDTIEQFQSLTAGKAA